MLNGDRSEQVPGCVPDKAEEESDSGFSPRRRQRSPVRARVPRSRSPFTTSLLESLLVVRVSELGTWPIQPSVMKRPRGVDGVRLMMTGAVLVVALLGPFTQGAYLP